MPLPARISFNGLDHCDDVEAYTRERIERLERLCTAATACRVVLERPWTPSATAAHGGRNLGVRVELDLPGERHLTGDQQRAETPLLRLETLVREAFEALERKLERQIA